jgi:hypothetical protein
MLQRRVKNCTHNARSPRERLDIFRQRGHCNGVNKVEQVESELRKLSAAELRQVRDWLEDFVEDQMEFTPEFETAIKQSEREMKSGARPRIRQP